MGHRFAEIAFTPGVQSIQSQRGSRERYTRFEQGDDSHFLLTEREQSFIEARDHFYMASVNEDGWPYVQHRGGPVGFLRLLDERTIGFADFRGNRQYVSVGNIQSDNRVSLILMDYAERRRLKILGRASVSTNTDIIRRLERPDYQATVEQAFLIGVEAYDWNCPQHITPRYSEAEIRTLLETMA